MEITLTFKQNVNVSILWFASMKTVILPTASMPGHLLCDFCPSKFSAAAILKCDLNCDLFL